MKAPRFSFAWFAGADLKILDTAPSDKTFYNALGASVLFLSIASGAALALAIGYMLKLPAGSVWWVGAAWTVLLSCGIERLLLQLPPARKALLVIVLVPRIILSLLLGVMLGEPLLLRMNEREIDNRLSSERVSAIERNVEVINGRFDPKIQAAKGEIARRRGLETRLRNRVVRYRFRSQRETDAVRADYYERLADLNALRLSDSRSRNRGRIGGLKSRVRNLRSSKRAALADRTTAINGNSGLVARMEALSALQKQYPIIKWGVWIIRIFFLVLDLLPLASKVLRMLTVESAYEINSAAARTTDALKGKQEQENAKTEGQQIEDQGRAKRRRNKAAANGHDFDEAFTPPGNETAEPVDGYALSEFAKSMTDHESRPITVPQTLRRGALIGMGLCLMTLLGALVFDADGFVLTLLATVLVGWILVQTNFARRTPAWGLKALFATFVGGLVLPLVVLALNV